MNIETVVNAFLTHKELLRDNGEIKPRTFKELHSTGVRIAEAFGKQRLISDVQPGDFVLLRASLAKTRGPVALGKQHVALLNGVVMLGSGHKSRRAC